MTPTRAAIQARNLALLRRHSVGTWRTGWRWRLLYELPLALAVSIAWHCADHVRGLAGHERVGKF